MTRADLDQLQNRCRSCKAAGSGRVYENLYDLIGERETIPGHEKLLRLLRKKERAWGKLAKRQDEYLTAKLALELLKTPEDKAQYDEFLKEREGQPQPSANPRDVDDQLVPPRPRERPRVPTGFGFPGFEFFGSFGLPSRLRWVPLLLLGVFGTAFLLDFVTGTRQDPTGGSLLQPPPPVEGNRESGLLEAEDELGLDRSARRRIQCGLEIAGFNPGPVDGVFGSRTRAALRQWQSQVGLSPTGFLRRPR